MNKSATHNSNKTGCRPALQVIYTIPVKSVWKRFVEVVKIDICHKSANFRYFRASCAK